MNYFMSYIDKENEFCINAKMYYVLKTIIIKKLKNEEIIKDDEDINNYKQTSNNIDRTLNRSNLIENTDFLLLYVEQQDSKHGGNNKNIYMLKPNSFKKLLIDIDTHNIRIVFIDYYIFLEKCIKIYDDYQFKLHNKFTTKLLGQKDDKIDEQSNKIDKLSNQIKELLGYAKDTKEINIDLLDDVKC